MRKLLLLAAGAVMLSGCYYRGEAWYQDPGALSAAEMAGYANVRIQRPSFTCGNGDRPTVLLNNSGYGQRGFFFLGTFSGHKVRGAVCEGNGQPPRIAVLELDGKSVPGMPSTPPI